MSRPRDRVFGQTVMSRLDPAISARPVLTDGFGRHVALRASNSARLASAEASPSHIAEKSRE